MHQRLPRLTTGHYSVFSPFDDIDRLDVLGRMSRVLNVNRPGLLSFYEDDHVERGGNIAQLCRQALIRSRPQASRQRMLSLIRACCGYVFNPISVYFAYDENGAPAALIYAVRNTFGERHTVAGLAW